MFSASHSSGILLAIASFNGIFIVLYFLLLGRAVDDEDIGTALRVFYKFSKVDTGAARFELFGGEMAVVGAHPFIIPDFRKAVMSHPDHRVGFGEDRVALIPLKRTPGGGGGCATDRVVRTAGVVGGIGHII